MDCFSNTSEIEDICIFRIYVNIFALYIPMEALNVYTFMHAVISYCRCSAAGYPEVENACYTFFLKRKVLKISIKIYTNSQIHQAAQYFEFNHKPQLFSYISCNLKCYLVCSNIAMLHQCATEASMSVPDQIK